MRTIHEEKNFRVVEFLPNCRMIGMGEPHTNSRGNVYLSFPYIQFGWYKGCPKGLGKETVCLFASFSNEPIKNIETPVFSMPFSCVYRDCLLICLQYNLYRNASLEKLIDIFWGSPFHISPYQGVVVNKDTPTYGDAFTEGLNLIPTIGEWVELTKKSPKRILEVNWGKSQGHRRFSPFGRSVCLSAIPKIFQKGVPH